MNEQQMGGPGLRLVELLAALSLAIDLGLGQPMEKFLRTCLLAVRLGALLGVAEEDLTAIYYLGLIQHLGCTAYADEATGIFGDDIAANTWLLTTDHGNPAELFSAMLRHIRQENAAPPRAWHILHVLLTLSRKKEDIFAGR